MDDFSTAPAIVALAAAGLALISLAWAGALSMRLRRLRAAQRIVLGVQSMSDLVLEQLKDVLDAYAQHNLELALDVWQRDETIDALYNSLFRELLTYMMEDPRNISYCAHLLFCAKNIERIGDHATNIAETIYYIATGAQPEGERPKDDTSNMLGSAGT